MIKHYTKYTIFVLIWIGFIWLLSDQSTLNVGLPKFTDLVFKKSAHIFVYTILGLLLTKAIIGYRAWAREEKYNLAGLVLLVFMTGLIFATLDELHQFIIPGRHGSPVDIFIDAMGLIAGIVWGMRHKTQQLRYSWKTLLTK